MAYEYQFPFLLSHLFFWGIGIGFVFFLLSKFLVNVRADEIAIMERRYIGAPLSSGRVFAAEGQIGMKAEYLMPGLHFIFWPITSVVFKTDFLVIDADELGIVEAMDGAALSANQLLGKSIANHSNFQRAEMFLDNGGQKGPQIDFLRPGTYNINTEMFQVEIHEAVRINEGQIGIVEARDGLPMDTSDVVVPSPSGHNNFQDGQAFLDNGGKRGPQESILTPGTYYINPYLFTVSIRNQTVVAQGEVGVLVSNIGRDPQEFVPKDAEGEDVNKSFTRHVVPKGFRGIQREVLGI